MGPAGGALSETAAPAADVWLLVGNRAGEVAQQRALGSALGLSIREIRVATMSAVGRRVDYDLAELKAPWPRLAISFGKTLPAALRVRRLSRGQVRIVHLGLPRKVAARDLDLVVPMPTDQYVEAPNVVRIAMPLNPAPRVDPGSVPVRRLLASTLPRPWTALFIGGDTKRLRLGTAGIAAVARAANQRALAVRGSLLVSTSPRTPPAASAVLRECITAAHELHVFDAGSGRPNPYPAYLNLADELIVTGDSASMIAECWRSGKPTWIAPLRQPPASRWMRSIRRAVPDALLRSGLVAGDVDLSSWVDRLLDGGRFGRLGGPGPALPYRADDDTDLGRVAARIGELLLPAGPR